MQGRILAALCAGLVTGCAGPAQLESSALSLVEQTSVKRAAAVDALAVDVVDAAVAVDAVTVEAVGVEAVGDEPVTVDVVALGAAQRGVVCRDRTRPGSRIVVGQTCRPRSETGMTAETLRELDRELTGRGFAPGWKTESQIDAEGALGAPLGAY